MDMSNCKLCGSSNTIVEKKFETADLIESYQTGFKIDIKEFAKNKEYSIIKCAECQFRYFDGSVSSGDSKFYEQLEKFDWYYMPWKWEHQITLSYLDSKKRVLEVGCGTGSFVEKAADISGAYIKGLELNEASVARAKSKGLELDNVLIEEFAPTNRQEFDVVCSFQVLEHISDVNSFIMSQVGVLKPGGRMIISVPNNDSFIKRDANDILNRPPHHANLWTADSLKYLSNLYPVELERIYYEPLQTYHVNWRVRIWLSKFPNIVVRVIRKLRLNILFEKVLDLFRKKIRGHTILVVFNKK
jgi:2-polyprenyl-3-methyl-5-hydroxy-6-metoxy-1,4-benzoquinol methylase